MAISPKQDEILAKEIRRIYEAAEIELLKLIAKRLYENDDVPDWSKSKLSLLSGLLREAREITGGLNKRIPKEIQRIINLAYLTGDKSALGDLENALRTIKEGKTDVPASLQMKLFPDDPEVKFDIESTMGSFDGVNTAAIQALAGATTKTIVATHVPIVRAVEDIYRQVVTEVIGTTLIGSETRREATQRILNKFASKGVKSFRDKGNRNWSMASYSEMAARTAIGQASLSGHIDKMQSMGFDLVQISNHAEECSLCRPWEGKVLSVSGDDKKHASLDKARKAGLFHPHCGHRANTYFEGLTKPLTNTADPEGDRERQKQRYIERQIRSWKQRQAVAMTPEAIRLSNDKVEQWQSVMKDFISDTGRRRKREREQNIKAR